MGHRSEARDETDFSQKLHILLAKAEIDDWSFVVNFSKAYRIDRRSAHSWFKSNEGARTPKLSTLGKIASYFRNEFEIDVSVSSFNLPLELFRTSVTRSNTRQKSSAITIDAETGEIHDPARQYLLGTFAIYRPYKPSAESNAQIAKEVAVISPSPKGQVLSAAFFAIPRTDADAPRSFRGTVFRADRLIQAILSEVDASPDMRRVLMFSFPISRPSRGSHQGLLMGYSERDDRPIASPIVVRKFANGQLPDQKARELVRILDPSHADAMQATNLMRGFRESIISLVDVEGGSSNLKARSS